MTYTQKQIEESTSTYSFCLNILQEIVKKTEHQNTGNINWYTFSEKVGKKFLIQASTLKRIFSEDCYVIKDNQQIYSLDFSSIATLCRLQLETYAIFNHLFIYGNIEERLVRFRLWELDGIRTQKKYIPPTNMEKEEDIINILSQFDYFKNLDEKKQKFLKKEACWRFTDESLKTKNWRISYEQMVINTGIKKDIFQHRYSIFSNFIHSSFVSVLMNSDFSEEKDRHRKYSAIGLNTFITAFFIKDFYKIYQAAKDVFNNLSTDNQEIINWYEREGRR
jgi:hypothetical protein